LIKKLKALYAKNLNEKALLKYLLLKILGRLKFRHFKNKGAKGLKIKKAKSPTSKGV